MKLHYVLILTLILSPSILGFSCTGKSQGENSAGDDTYLDDGRRPEEDTGQGYCAFNGSIAVDHRDETAFTVLSSVGMECSEWEELDQDGPSVQPTKELWAMGRNSQPERVMDMTGKTDLRVLFPQDQVLLMTEEGGRDTLTFLEPDTWRTLETVNPGVKYHGTRTSATRRYVAVADNTSQQPDIHVIDTQTHQVAVIPNQADWLEAMFTHQRDELVAILFHDGWTDEADGYARILKWSASEDHPTGGILRTEVTDDGVWQGADIDLRVDNVEGDLFFSYTWVGISPDDRWAAFPVVEDLPGNQGNEEILNGRKQLIVVDLQNGTHRMVNDAYGPVGFTPDGSTIVSYRYVEPLPSNQDEENSTDPALVLIDVETLEETVVPLRMIMSGPEFFVTSDQNKVLITCPFNGSNVVIHDVDSGETEEVAVPEGVTLSEFVQRPEKEEVWLVSNGLYHLNYGDSVMSPVDVGFTPQHINRLPHSDLLVLDDPERRELVWLDPDSRQVTSRRQLPLPSYIRE